MERAAPRGAFVYDVGSAGVHDLAVKPIEHVRRSRPLSNELAVMGLDERERSLARHTSHPCDGAIGVLTITLRGSRATGKRRRALCRGAARTARIRAGQSDYLLLLVVRLDLEIWPGTGVPSHLAAADPAIGVETLPGGDGRRRCVRKGLAHHLRCLRARLAPVGDVKAKTALVYVGHIATTRYRFGGRGGVRY